MTEEEVLAVIADLQNQIHKLEDRTMSVEAKRRTDGGPAFPVDNEVYGPEGMSLRDYFAGKAMQALLVGLDEPPANNILAKWAYAYADAMLKEREK